MSGEGKMYKDKCGCKSKGRLFVYIKSDFAKEVKITLIEANKYKDVYRVAIKDGVGKLMVDAISMGELTIDSDLDKENTLYYPGNKICFTLEEYVHKVTIFDRRK